MRDAPYATFSNPQAGNTYRRAEKGSSFGPRALDRGDIHDLRAYARQAMQEDILTLASRAREARCYWKQVKSCPSAKDGMFAKAVKITLVAFQKRLPEYRKVIKLDRRPRVG